MDLHQYVIQRLEAARGTWGKVAQESGVSKRTLEKIARREIADPGISHIQKLADYFRERQ